jgi:Luciferase
MSGDRLIDEVTAWAGVTVEEGRFGSTRFMLGRRELGHVHGSSILDLPLPKPLKAELIERGVAIQHRFTPPESGWVTIELDDADAVERSIEILRERYEHAVALRDARAQAR